MIIKYVPNYRSKLDITKPLTSLDIVNKFIFTFFGTNMVINSYL